MMFRWEGRSVAIDFRLTASQRELQLRSRKFAKEVLSRCDRGRDAAHPGATVCRNQARLRGHDCGRISAEMHSSIRRGRERWSDRYRDHGRGTLRGERQHYIDVDWNCAWPVAALDWRHGRAADPVAASILETSRGAAGGVLRYRTRRQRQSSIAPAGRRRTYHGDASG